MPGRPHHTDKMRRCVDQVMAKGHDESSAYAICTTSMHNAGEPIFEAASEQEPEIKTLEGSESRTLHVLGATGVVRREILNDRSYLVVPIVALMEGVIHAVNAETPEFVPGEVLQRAAASWIGKPVTLGHPAKGGKQCSANDSEIRKASGIGVIMSSEFDGRRLKQEAWIDEQKVRELHPRMFENLASGGTEEVSVGAHVVTNSIGSSYNGKLYKGTWLEASGDHLAFLPGGRGACSCEMGCGTFRAAMHFVADEEIQSITAETILALADKSLDEMFETVERWQAAAKKRKDCPMCQGAGNKDGNSCEVCSGKGYMKTDLKAAGGPGSGNFGHGGRPGQVGGSSSEGGGGKSGDFATKEAAKASRPYGAEVLKGRGTQKQIKGFLDDMEEGENDLRDWGKKELRDQFENWKSENSDMQERLRVEGKTLPGEFATKKEAEASRPWGAAKLEGQGTPKQIKGFIDDMVEGENDLRNWSTQELRDEFENWKAENSDGPDLPGMKKVDHFVNGVRVPTYEKKKLRGAEDRIKHEGGKYVLYSSDGYRKLAEHLSLHAAEKHLEAIQRILASK